MTDPDLTVEALQRAVAELVDEEPESIEGGTDLFELGLESIALMQLVGRWRRRGIEVNFAELASNPTIEVWSKLLIQRAMVGQGPPVAVNVTQAADADVLFPLALMQHAYWVGRDDAQRLGGVAAHLYNEFDGTLVDPVRLTSSIERLVARHDMLRVRVTDNGQQQILPVSGWRGLTVHDLRELDRAAIDLRLQEIRDSLSHQMLDIERGEVMSTALSLLPDGRTRLHVDVDMVAADAVSYRILLADLARCYEDFGSALAMVDYTYRRYLAERAVARRSATQRATEWWQRRLPDLPGAPELPRDRRPDSGARQAATQVRRRHFWLPAHDRAALMAAARQRGVTTAMAVAAAFVEVLGAWSTESRFLLNVPLFDRASLHPEVDQLVGDFTSSVLLEIDLTARCGFVERVRQLQSQMHTSAAYADYSGVEVLRDLARQRGEQVIAPVVFTSALNLGELFDPAVRRCFGDPVWIISQGPQVLLDAQITELSAGLLVNWDMRVHEFAPGVGDAMFSAFERLIRRLIDDEATWNQPVDRLLPQYQLEVRAQLNDTAAPRSGRLLHQGFFEWSRRTPAAPALLWSECAALTYGELADRALRVAAALRKGGIEPGEPVGVTLPKGPNQAIAVLGVLAAGGVYVPIGLAHPASRAERIERVAGCRMVITDGGGPDEDRPLTGAVRLSLASALATEPTDGPVLGAEESLAYILFTSGSTGEPKGVEVPHRAAMNTIDDLSERFALGTADRTLAVSALDFDLSVFDLFAPWSVGGAVVLVDQDAGQDAQSWAELIRERRVSVLNCVPALLDMLLTTGADLGSSLRVVLLGGDRVGVDLPDRLHAAVPGCRFVGLGGTTETAIHSTACEVATAPADWRSVPYGTPLRNVVCRIVDPQGRDCPDWVAGELWIGGDGVALGYRADPERSADRFLEHSGTRWYRTGDLGWYWPDGTIEFLGRRDNQVKIRGFRIELGEVEAALLAQSGVRAAVAVVAGRRPGVLAAGVVVDGQTTPEQLTTGICALVPAYMVPERVVMLPMVPLTANGKVDRKAVRTLVEQALHHRVTTSRVAPRTDLERVIARVWGEVLALDEVGVHDEFFSLGGDSVLATSIIARLREYLDSTAVSVRMLFSGLTIAAMAEQILAADEVPGRLEEVSKIFLEIAALSDDEVVSRLDESSPSSPERRADHAAGRVRD